MDTFVVMEYYAAVKSNELGRWQQQHRFKGKNDWVKKKRTDTRSRS